MHLAVQSTSPASQALMQAAAEDWAGVREATVEAVEAVVVVADSVVWALARRAKAPVTRMLVKRIL